MPPTPSWRVSSQGGGLIYINASAGVHLDGTLSADGQTPCTLQTPCWAGPGPAPASMPLACCDPQRVLPDQECEGLGGASGGTVVVHTGDRSAVNGSGVVTARGATGTQFNAGSDVTPTAGGAGGRVQLPCCAIDETIAMPHCAQHVLYGVKADASGGSHSEQEPGQCDSGGAGTVLYDDCGQGATRITVDNSGKPTGSRSHIVGSYEPAHHPHELQVSNGALLEQQSGMSIYAINSISLRQGAKISLDFGQDIVTPQLELVSSVIAGTTPDRERMRRARSLFSGGEPRASVAVAPGGEPSADAPWRKSDTISSISVDSLSMDELSTITDVPSIQVSNSGLGPNSGKMSGDLFCSTPLALNVSGQFIVGPLGTINAPRLAILADTMQVEGKVQASSSVDSACPSFVLDCDQNATLHADDLHAELHARELDELLGPGADHDCSYPLQLLINSLQLSSGVVAAPAAKVCADSLLIDAGLMTASALGHPAGTGKGAGCVEQREGVGVGAGSGGGHGGAGGTAALFSNITGCTGGQTYDAPANPGDLGSGGGGTNGGTGGGLIHVQARTELSLVGTGGLQADGAPHQHKQAVGQPAAGAEAEGGSGGGAGGSIVLQVNALYVSQSSGIHADGGDGMPPGGGGGGGGRIHLQPLPGEYDWPNPPSPYILSRVHSDHGKGGGSGSVPGQKPGSDGSDSPLTGRNCSLGQWGALCEGCAVGTAKAFRGPDACVPCTPGTYASQTGQASCTPCPPGQYADFDQATGCIECEPGHYSAVNGSVDCTPCAAGTAWPWAGSSHSCDQCQAGWYSHAGMANCTTCDAAHKVMKNQTGCDACPTKPPNSQYVDEGINKCHWDCIPPRLRSLDGRSCVLLAQLLLPENVGGTFLLFISPVIGLAVLTSILCAGPAVGKRRRAELAASRHFGHPDESVKDLTTAARGLEEEREGPRERLHREPSVIASGHESLRQALMYDKHKYRAKQHVLRLHLSGRNSALHPWRLPPLTSELRRLVSEESYYKFAERFGAAATWSLWELILISVLSVLPPLSTHFLRHRRAVHWRRVKLLVTRTTGSAPEGGLEWRSMYSRVWESQRMELGCCGSHTLGWLDIFDQVYAPLVHGAGPTQLQMPGGAGPSLSAPGQLAPQNAPLMPRPPDNTPRHTPRDGHDSGPPFRRPSVEGAADGRGSPLGKLPASTLLDRFNTSADPRELSFCHPGPDARDGSRSSSPSLPPPPPFGTMAPAPAAYGAAAPATSSPPSLPLQPMQPMPMAPVDRPLGGAGAWPAPATDPSGLSMPKPLHPPGAEGGITWPKPLQADPFEARDSRGDAAAAHEAFLTLPQPGLQPDPAPNPGFGLQTGGGGGGSGGVTPQGGTPPPSSLASSTRNSISVDLRGGVQGGPQGGPRSASPGAAESTSPAEQVEPQVEPRVSHRLSICGEGTYLDPLWLELADFFVYDALSTALDYSGAAVVACINARLSTLDRWSSSVRLKQRLGEVVELIAAVNAQQAAQAARTSGLPPVERHEAAVLGLVSMPPMSDSTHRFLMLLIGKGEATEWAQPAGATLLTAATLETHPSLPGLYDETRPMPLFGFLAELAHRAFFGPCRPLTRPGAAMCVVLLLLLTEAIITVLVLTGLCVPERTISCATSVLGLPFASVLSPIAGLYLLARVASILRGMANGKEKALTAASSGELVRALHLASVWNAASMPNAIIAQAMFIPVAAAEPGPYEASQLWVLPLILIVTKLICAQAIKIVAAGAGLTEGEHRMLDAFENLRRWKQAHQDDEGIRPPTELE